MLESKQKVLPDAIDLDAIRPWAYSAISQRRLA
jgi:hypothetical protein